MFKLSYCTILTACNKSLFCYMLYLEVEYISCHSQSPAWTFKMPLFINGKKILVWRVMILLAKVSEHLLIFLALPIEILKCIYNAGAKITFRVTGFWYIMGKTQFRTIVLLNCNYIIWRIFHKVICFLVFASTVYINEEHSIILV